MKGGRLLRQQAAVGLSAKRAKFEFISLNEPGWPALEARAALKAARQDHYVWKSRPPSAHALRDEELAEAISHSADCASMGHHRIIERQNNYLFAVVIYTLRVYVHFG